jgi:16S rRNA (guanine1207-N2)-methyltransferase
MRSSRLELALETGALPLPADGLIAVYGPRTGDVLSSLPQGRVQVVTGFCPDHDAFAAQGYSVRHDGAGQYAAAVVCLPRAKSAARALLAQAAAEVTPGGIIAVDGQKTDGIDTALKDLRARLSVSDPLSKAHGKLFTFAASDALRDWQATPTIIDGGFQTLPGVFSADGPDAGSVLLAAALPAKLGGRVADLGAGWGYLARTIFARDGVKSLDLVEADHAALTCARVNVTDPRAVFHWADVRTFRPAHQMDTVVMNPPFHAGRDADPSLGVAFLRAARTMLAPSGSLWLVANRGLPYMPVLATLFRHVEDMGGTPAYRLTRCSLPLRPEEKPHVPVHRR